MPALRALRLILGLSQADVAELAGVSQRAVSFAETSPRPKTATIERYISALALAGLGRLDSLQEA